MSSPLLAGRYELEDLPVRGSMSDVFTGYDQRLDRRVTIKRVRRDLSGDPETLKRFEREARLTGRVKHPGVPSVLDYGADADGPYLVMEYVDGASLHDLVVEFGALPAAWVAAIGAQICAILDHTHAASLIHRDLKPANVLLRPDGTVAVIDFGVAAITGASRLSTLTAAGITAGTAEYQAPERRLGVESPLTDLYAVGCVLRDLSIGTLPNVNTALTGAAPDARLLALIHELTATRPQDRPPGARAVVDRLLPMVGPLAPLPGFVPDARAVASHLAAYASAPASSSVRSVPLGDLSHLRRRAEQHARDGRLRQAIELMDHLVTAAVAAADPVTVDLQWEQAGWLFEAGDSTRLAAELAGLIDQLVDRFGTEHPVVTSARLMLARAEAAGGRVRESLAVLQHLIADLAAAWGVHDPRLYAARLEQGIQLAVAGDAAQAAATLRSLADDQREYLEPHHPDLSVTLDALLAV